MTPMNTDTKLRDLRRKAMFYLGYTTQQIADIEGVIKNTIVSWRQVRGIKPNMIKEGDRCKTG